MFPICVRSLAFVLSIIDENGGGPGVRRRRIELSRGIASIDES